jgi:hypothetical protein
MPEISQQDLDKLKAARHELTHLLDEKTDALAKPVPGERSALGFNDAATARIRLDALIDWIWPDEGDSGANPESIAARNQFEIHYLNNHIGALDSLDQQGREMYRELLKKGGGLVGPDGAAIGNNRAARRSNRRRGILPG